MPTIRELVQRLTPAQRHGLHSLPTPLPLVPAIALRFADLELDERDRELLLALAVRLDDALGPLLAFDGRTATELADASVADHVLVHAGRARLVDARLSVWVQATTCAARTAAVHQRLSALFRARGERASADWHQARASLEGAPSTAPGLTRLARRLSEAGQPDRALLLATEAHRHAVGDAKDEACLVAGASALSAGLAAEAAAWLGGLYPRGSTHHRIAGLGALIVARTFVQGAVPAVDPTTLRSRTLDQEDWRHWTRAAALAAVLCAERGDRIGMRTWLDVLRDGAARADAGDELRDPAVALCWLIVGDRGGDAVSGAGPASGGMLRALRAATDGDIDRALRLLSTDGSVLSVGPDPLVPGYENSPVIQAYRAVIEVLLLVWRGDIGLARDRLMQSALRLPIAMPFAGLGVVLARRLDVAVLGELGPFARSLTAALPVGVKVDLLVDRGIRSFLAGSFDEAAATFRLWSDRGAPQPTLVVPGLEEMAFVGQESVRTAAVEPPEIALAQELRIRIATAGTDGGPPRAKR